MILLLKIFDFRVKKLAAVPVDQHVKMVGPVIQILEDVLVCLVFQDQLVVGLFVHQNV